MTEEVIVKDHAAETDQAINLGTRLLLMVAVVLIKEEMAKVVIILGMLLNFFCILIP